MASSSSDTSSGLDQILKNTEFENEKQLKAIKAEKERIQTCEAQLKEKKAQIVQLEKSISDLDEYATHLHKQFLLNRDNCESLKRTAVVLADHEEALKAKLAAVTKEAEDEKHQQVETLNKYERIWETYRSKYEGMEKMQEVKRIEAEVQQLKEQDADLDLQISQLKQKLQAARQQEAGNTLVSMVLKMANLRVETAKTKEMISTKSEQEVQLEKEIHTLCEQIRVEKLKRQREKEEQQRALQVMHNAMEIESTNNHQSIPVTSESQPPPTNGPQTVNTSTGPTPSLQQRPPARAPPKQMAIATVQPQAPLTLPSRTATTLPSLAPTNSAPARQPSRYQLEIPKLSMPPRVSNIRSQTASIVSSPLRIAQSNRSQASTTMSSTLLTQPFISISSPQPRLNFQIPSSTPARIQAIPRPSIPLLHTPTQLSFSIQSPQPRLPSVPTIRSAPLQQLPTVPSSRPSTHSQLTLTPTRSVPQISPLTLMKTITSPPNITAPTPSNSAQSSVTQPQITVSQQQQPAPNTTPEENEVNPLSVTAEMQEAELSPITPSYEMDTHDMQVNEGTMELNVTNEQDSRVDEVESSQGFDDWGFPDGDGSQSFAIGDFEGGFGQVEGKSFGNEQTQLGFTGEDSGLVYGMEGSLGGQGEQPDMSADDGFGLNFGQSSQSDVSDGGFLFGGNMGTESQSGDLFASSGDDGAGSSFVFNF